MEENITGGVSPMKAYKGRRGKSSGKGKRGTGDTRYKRDKWRKPASGGTTTIPRKMGQLPPPPGKPYKIVDGKVVPNVTNNYYNTVNQTQGGNPNTKKTTKTTDGKPGTEDEFGTRMVTKTKDYSKVWKGPKSSKYPDGMPYDVWIKQKGNKEKEKKFVKSQQYQEEEKYLIKKGTDPVPATSETIEEVLEGSGNNNTMSAVINNNAPGKYRLGGYRAMKNNRKK